MFASNSLTKKCKHLGVSPTFCNDTNKFEKNWKSLYRVSLFYTEYWLILFYFCDWNWKSLLRCISLSVWGIVWVLPKLLCYWMLHYFVFGTWPLSNRPITQMVSHCVLFLFLKDPSDKRIIISDEKLRELFDVDTFNGFTVSKLLNVHFIKTEQWVALILPLVMPKELGDFACEFSVSL